MRLRLGEIAQALGVDAPAARDVAVSGYSIDSRTIVPGDVFFAIPGEHFDGHDYLPEVFAKGAIAAVVSRKVNAGGLLIEVPDTIRALQDLALWIRDRWGGPLVAVTGSAGKTSTKDVIAHLLSSKFRVGKSSGNLNNHLGVPLSLLRLPDESQTAVLEMGMNHAGEIRRLAEIAAPDVGVVTNVGYAHVENFDSIEGIAMAKRELVEQLKPQGVAVLNADDERVRNFGEVHKGQTILYGLSEDAQVRATDVSVHSEGVCFSVDGENFRSSLQGLHSVRNILAGIAVCKIFGIETAELLESARTLSTGRMRGERLNKDGIQILNDCYNSNPEAARAMLEALRATPAQRRIAVLGEMLELGRWSEPKHREIGTYAAMLGIDVLVGIRGAAQQMVDAAIEAGLSENAAYFFSESEEAGEHLRSIARPGDAILFKGSRGTRVELALERFIA